MEFGAEDTDTWGRFSLLTGLIIARAGTFIFRVTLFSHSDTSPGPES